MTKGWISLASAVALIAVGFSITELQLYPNYRADPSWTENASAIFALVLAGIAVVCVVALVDRREVGGGVVAMVVGAFLFFLLLRTADPLYYLPPLIVVSGGLFGIHAYANRARTESNAATPTSGP